MQKTRKNIRLAGYDYSRGGYYFVTICSQNRVNLFGNVVWGKMVLNEFGKIVDEKMNEITKNKNVDIDIYCVMPNHVHFVLIIVGADLRVRPNDLGSTQGSTPTVGECVKRLKTYTTRMYIEKVNNNHWQPFERRLWQRNYYERIIRNEKEYLKIIDYIQLNPSIWLRDRNNLENK